MPRPHDRARLKVAWPTAVGRCLRAVRQFPALTSSAPPRADEGTHTRNGATSSSGCPAGCGGREIPWYPTVSEPLVPGSERLRAGSPAYMATERMSGRPPGPGARLRRNEALRGKRAVTVRAGHHHAQEPVWALERLCGNTDAWRSGPSGRPPPAGDGGSYGRAMWDAARPLLRVASKPKHSTCVRARQRGAGPTKQGTGTYAVSDARPPTLTKAGGQRRAAPTTARRRADSSRLSTGRARADNGAVVGVLAHPGMK